MGEVVVREKRDTRKFLENTVEGLKKKIKTN